MPDAADTFQQIGKQGPFSGYLSPVQPRAIDAPMAGSTGWESKPVAAGEIGLSFLKAVRQNRLAKAHEEDANVEAGLNNFRAYTNSQLQNPDLTDEARQKILADANTVMNQHMHYVLKDAPKDGVAGFFKNLLVNASGGPIKSREPINWDEATGKIATTASAPQYSQKANFQTAVAEAQQAVNALKQKNPYPTQQEVEQAVSGAYQKVSMNAPRYIDTFRQAMGVAMEPSYPVAGSSEAMMNQLRQAAPGQAAIPATQPPPAAPRPTPPVVDERGNVSIPYVNAPGLAPPVGADNIPARGISYVPGYGPDRFAVLSHIAKMGQTGINMTAPHPVITENGVRTTGVYVSGSTAAPGDNGYWDATTGQRINGRTVPVSLSEGRHVVRRGPDNWAIIYDSNLGKNTYDLGPDGKPYKIPENFVAVTDAAGNVVWAPKSQAAGQTTGGQGLETKREAAAANRQATWIGAGDRRQDTTRAHDKATLNLSYDHRIDALKRSARGAVTATALPGHPPSPQALAQAEASVQPQIDAINKERAEALSAFDASGSSVPRTVAPPTAPAPATDRPPAAPQKPPATVSGADFLKD